MENQPHPDQLYPNQAAQPAPNARDAAPAPQHQPPQQPPPQQQPPQQPPPQQQPPQQQPPQQQYPQQGAQQHYPQQGAPQQQPPQQYQVIVQTAPAYRGSCGSSFENYKADQSLGLGITQCLIGVLCILFNIVGIVMLNHDESSYNYRYYTYEWIFYSGYGIWNGLFFILAGAFGIGARSKNPCPVIAFMVLSIIAAVMTTFVIGFASGGISETRYSDGDSYYYGISWDTSNGVNDSRQHGKMAMHAMMLILAFVELVVSIWSSVICCHAACCCRDHRGTVHAAPMVQYAQGAPGNGQQQVFIHTTGGQPQPYYVQQPGPSGVVQTTSYPGGAYPGGSGMNQPQASAPAVPPPYSSAGAAPPAYGSPQEKSGMPPAAY